MRTTYNQFDIKAIQATQSNLSPTLARKKKIGATLAVRLGKFFGISTSVFVPA